MKARSNNSIPSLGMTVRLSVENLDDLQGGEDARRADLLERRDAALSVDTIDTALAVGEDMLN